MRITITILYLGALNYTVFSSPPSPVNVIFSSLNLRNVLHWHPGNDTSQNTHYTVQYAIYGDRVEDGGRRVRWRPVLHCTDTTRSSCDLTNETWDLEQGYYARVRARGSRGSSKWTVTQRRFEPKADTSFGPPLVSVVIEEDSAIISLKGPLRYQPDNHTPEVSMATLYPQMTYNLSVHNARQNQTRYFPVDSSQFRYRLLEYDTEYCFSAKARFLSMPASCHRSAWHCITTAPDPVVGQLQRVILGIVIPSVCMCMLVVAGYLLCHSLRGNGHKRPHILDLSPIHSTPLTFCPENLNIILIPVINSKLSSVTKNNHTCPKPQEPIPVLPHFPSYARQMPIFPEPEELWENESLDYGFAAAASELNEEGGRTQMSDGGGDRDHLVSGERREDEVRDSCERGESDHSTKADAPSLNPYKRQKTAHTFVQAHSWSHVQTFIPPQTPFQGRIEGQTEGGEDDSVNARLSIKIDPHTGLLHFPLHSQTQKEGGTKGRTDGVIVEKVEEEMEREQVPLLSPQDQQHTEALPPSCAGQLRYFSNDCAFLRVATEQDTEEMELEGSSFVNWDPETRKLVLPEMEREIMREGGLIQGEEMQECGMNGGEEEEEEEQQGPRLESVLVRQVSAEVEEAQRGMETKRETGWQAGNMLTSWEVVIKMDQ
ncbi:interleukin-20 receptor subunit alpha [Myripristis murdjan]|uniref:interleukin-20 receptor subunit alpha n=1 Tax=Myripristis murdjan TaxID=586833 RepID=UPI001175F4EF|nr:interleukin-20 receptor subunit alpha-like [Myripristis murdjan]